jgi:hypothetical protein
VKMRTGTLAGTRTILASSLPGVDGKDLATR